MVQMSKFYFFEKVIPFLSFRMQVRSKSANINGTSLSSYLKPRFTRFIISHSRKFLISRNFIVRGTGSFDFEGSGGGGGRRRGRFWKKFLQHPKIRKQIALAKLYIMHRFLTGKNLCFVYQWWGRGGGVKSLHRPNFHLPLPPQKSNSPPLMDEAKADQTVHLASIHSRFRMYSRPCGAGVKVWSSLYSTTILILR